MDTPPPPIANAPTKRPRYRLYVDESGDHTYKKLENVWDQFLTLLGVFMDGPSYLGFHRDLLAFKNKYFGMRLDEPVVLHRSDIVGRKGAFGILKDNALRQRFDADLLELVGQANFRVIAIIMDKKSHLSRYKYPEHPYHYCLEALMERYCNSLSDAGAVGDIMAESRGTEEDGQLKKVYFKTYTNGSSYFKASDYQRVLTTKDLKVKPKFTNVFGLQLADILAHPIKRDALAKKGLVPDKSDNFSKELCKLISGKFRCHPGTGRIDGYGIKWL